MREVIECNGCWSGYGWRCSGHIEGRGKRSVHGKIRGYDERNELHELI